MSQLLFLLVTDKILYVQIVLVNHLVDLMLPRLTDWLDMIEIVLTWLPNPRTNRTKQTEQTIRKKQTVYEDEECYESCTRKALHQGNVDGSLVNRLTG